MASFEEILDGALCLPQDKPPFTKLIMSTCVLAAKVIPLEVEERIQHRELIPLLQEIGLPADGAVVAINSNFGGVANLRGKDFLKEGGKQMPLAPAGRKHRQPEGRGGSFNSALEPVLLMPSDAAPYAVLQEQGKNITKYMLKYFPTTGSMQVAGVKDHNLTDGMWAINQWVEFLNDTQILGGDTGIVPGTVRPEMMNFKFQLRKVADRQLINYVLFFEIVMGEVKSVDPKTIKFKGWPAPIIEATVKDNSETSAISFKFSFGKKMPRVNVHPESGKINFMGFSSMEFARGVYDAFLDLFSQNWDKLVILAPLEDDAPKVRAKEAESAMRILLERSFARLPDQPKSWLADEEFLAMLVSDPREPWSGAKGSEDVEQSPGDLSSDALPQLDIDGLLHALDGTDESAHDLASLIGQADEP